MKERKKKREEKEKRRKRRRRRRKREGERGRKKEEGEGGRRRKEGGRADRPHNIHFPSFVHEKCHRFHHFSYEQCFVMLSTKEATENCLREQLCPKT